MSSGCELHVLDVNHSFRLKLSEVWGGGGGGSGGGGGGGGGGGTGGGVGGEVVVVVVVLEVPAMKLAGRMCKMSACSFCLPRSDLLVQDYLGQFNRVVLAKATSRVLPMFTGHRSWCIKLEAFLVLFTLPSSRDKDLSLGLARELPGGFSRFTTTRIVPARSAGKSPASP